MCIVNGKGQGISVRNGVSAEQTGSGGAGSFELTFMFFKFIAGHDDLTAHRFAVPEQRLRSVSGTVYGDDAGFVADIVPFVTVAAGGKDFAVPVSCHAVVFGGKYQNFFRRAAVLFAPVDKFFKGIDFLKREHGDIVTDG